MRSREHRSLDGGLAVGRRAVRRTLAATAVVSLAAALAACGGSSGGSSAASTPSAAVSAVATLPAALAGKTLTAAADASYAPNEFFDTDGKTVVGMDADLIKALGTALGTKVDVKNVGFDDIIPALDAGKYNIGISSFTDTKEREAKVDFVTYFSAGTSFFTSADKPAAVKTLDDLCGLTVAVEKGTTQADDATAQDGTCKTAGKPGVTVSQFPDQNGANLALTSGRAQVSMADSPVADYQVKLSDGKLKLVGTPYGTAPYGIAVPKNSGLAQPLLTALKSLIADGTYKQILTKWGVEDGAITSPQINGATS
ncbi:ABC transporter substrate-binding protein [Frankia sp. AgB1.9]|uniref:ABC transporter substrate-binding protein n=1 Tax=unclassified Frankia TaxID=2632575 RepID=UPI001932E675|nr:MULTISPECIES: ABC transporter substrate-binding protein [unclassified Frankia]MBL7488893.1 ABC transporter substrate-binding protein [Frankia sp. AgW1.1]MBL7547629.1 ABC transporter substrate-binding protein [Frankia sp. AgB1.9]MBL7619535.1 ABC transporter substrate-binding protein [Frankia sp. AgB1.8]